MRTDRVDDGTVVAVPTTTTTPPVEAGPAEVSPAAPAAPAAPRPGWTTWLTAQRVCALVGIVVPLIVLTVWCSRLVPSFDGAMNLQVAWNVANGDGYVRFYGGETMFPPEIETSGAFIFIAAGFLKIFGMSYFSLMATNLLFLAGVVVGVSLAVRQWPAAQLLAPSLVLLCVPDLSQFGAAGYGEIPVAALMLWALLLQASVIAGANRPVLRMTGAFALLGVALTIKIVAVAGIPVLLVGLAVALVVRRDTSRWRLLLTAVVAAVPVLLFELYRFVSLGSWAAYKGFWAGLLPAVGQQSGVTADEKKTLIQKGFDHVHLLSSQTGVSAELLVIMLATPAILLVLAFLLRRTGWREWLAAPGRALAVLLATYGYLYLAWWLFVTPTQKAWLRRVIIGLLMLNLLLVLLLCFATDRARDLRYDTRAVQIVIGVVGVACVALVAGTLWGHSKAASYNWDRVVFSSSEAQRNLTLAADQARQYDEDGYHLYGGGWWSAPAVSLIAQIPFADFVDLDPCVPADRAVLADERAVFVWDRYGMGIVSPTPSQIGFEFEKMSQPSPYASFWRLTFAPDACPFG